MGSVTDHDAGTLSELDLLAISHIKPGGNWRDLPEDFPSKRVQQIREGARAGTGTRSSYYGRLRWDTTSSTIATYFVRPGNGANIHPAASRTLTFREAARLQGFQDSIRFHGSRRARAIQIGNAVPPPVAARLANALPARGLAVELFAGAGGLTAGVGAAGFTTLAVADNNRHALKTLVGHVSPYITPAPVDLSSEDERRQFVAVVRKAAGDERLSLLAGGPPCQGFSMAGNNRLFADPRNNLPDAFLWTVQQLRPRQVLFENVAALTWKSRRPWFDRLCGYLMELGYAVSWRLVHCEAYGLPQRRRRVVVVATEPGLPTFDFPVGPHRIELPAYWKTAQDEGGHPVVAPTVREAIGDLPLEPASDDGQEVGLRDDGVQVPYRRYVTGRTGLAEYASL